MKMTGADVIGLDWTVDMADARQRLGLEMPVQVMEHINTFETMQSCCEGATMPFAWVYHGGFCLSGSFIVVASLEGFPKSVFFVIFGRLMVVGRDLSCWHSLMATADPSQSREWCRTMVWV